MKTKTAEEVLKENLSGVYAFSSKENLPEVRQKIIRAMHSHTSQYLDLCVEIIKKREVQFLHRDYTDELVQNILELKNNMK